MQFSDYIVFVDESGDHNLEVVNPEFPVFVLAFCVFSKTDYVEQVCPRVQAFKLNWFGHDALVLHEREIRKDLAPFEFLKTPHIKEQFIGELTSIIASTPMTIIAAVIRKDALRSRYRNPDNPYHLALLFCIERLSAFLAQKGQSGTLTHILFEQRGGKAGGGHEDRILELEFRRIMAGQHYLARSGFTGLDLKIIPKTSNSIGLQLADLVARPIGIRCIRPRQTNRSFDIIKKKLLAGSLKTFP
ncbi:DUF3800 domain-containing protein [Chelativorans composti]